MFAEYLDQRLESLKSAPLKRPEKPRRLRPETLAKIHALHERHPRAHVAAILALAGAPRVQFDCPLCGQRREDALCYAETVLDGRPTLCPCPPVERQSALGTQRRCRGCRRWRYLPDFDRRGGAALTSRRTICLECLADRRRKSWAKSNKRRRS